MQGIADADSTLVTWRPLSHRHISFHEATVYLRLTVKCGSGYGPTRSHMDGDACSESSSTWPEPSMSCPSIAHEHRDDTREVFQKEQ